MKKVITFLLIIALTLSAVSISGCIGSGTSNSNQNHTPTHTGAGAGAGTGTETTPTQTHAYSQSQTSTSTPTSTTTPTETQTQTQTNTQTSTPTKNKVVNMTINQLIDKYGEPNKAEAYWGSVGIGNAPAINFAGAGLYFKLVIPLNFDGVARITGGTLTAIVTLSSNYSKFVTTVRTSAHGGYILIKDIYGHILYYEYPVMTTGNPILNVSLMRHYYGKPFTTKVMVQPSSNDTARDYYSINTTNIDGFAVKGSKVVVYFDVVINYIGKQFPAKLLNNLTVRIHVKLDGKDYGTYLLKLTADQFEHPSNYPYEKAVRVS